MTLRVVSSNEDAQQQQQQQSSDDTNTMEVTSSSPSAAANDQMTRSQDSGYGGASQSARKYLGQNLRITACANQGGRKYMEDRVHVHVHRNPASGDVDWTFVAVYDGHGGPEASEYCRRHLLKNIRAEKGFDSEVDAEFLEAIRNGYLTTHHTMWKDVDSWARTASGYPSTAGTTASCAFIRRGKVYVGHVGDSAILLTTRSSPQRFYRLTEDHKPELPAERKRIEAAGGAIMQKQCVYRVVWTRAIIGYVGPIRRSTPTQTIPFLAVARSLGDFWSYIESTQEFSVSPCPDVSVHTLTADHHSLVLASDGLTNVMSADLEAAIMHDLAEEEHQRNWFKNPYEQPNHARIMMRRTLLNWRRFRADNVSVLAEADSRPSSPAHDAPVELCASTADVDAQLAEHPMCMIHVTNERVMRYATARVALRYNGQFDNNFHYDTMRSLNDRLHQFYDMLGIGERDVTPENQPPPTATHNLTNRVSILVEKKPSASSPVLSCPAAAIIIDELRRDGDATAAAAAAAAASVAAASADAADGAPERPATPENRPDGMFAVLRTTRSSGKRKSRMIAPEEAPSTSSAAREADDDDESMDASESESATNDAALIKLSLPFAADDDDVNRVEEEERDEREELMRTPSPIGDAAVGGVISARATPLVNTVATEREVVRRVTRSAAASTVESREMVVVERPATRRSSSRRLQLQQQPGGADDATAAAPTTPAAGSAPSSNSAPSPARTPKLVLEVDDHIATRTRSRNGEVTPPASAFTPATSASGSRKRPRAAAGGGASTSSTATPLLARISLAEMNENAGSSAGSSGDGSDKKAEGGPTNKSARTESPWVRVRCEEEDGQAVGGEEQTFYEVVPATGSEPEEAWEDEDRGEPPAKRFRLWGMLKKWWSGGE
ncbi:ppm-1.D [Pristionchus pacificus]|uniref:PPM-type phosphatase domain-containing protein n=1 Tax=Pristionchus pacificus TaxID=54126 RepID=A0A2A6CE19_PRIPA|nr:ppm-1.D [Pristionchus pacificus]|eukprot:PDM76359.1 hypothetical protein PRIPAC_39963 [Pristionchus pacificus]